MFVLFCLLLYAGLSLQFVYMYALHVLCACCIYLLCVWGKPTKGVRTLDSCRVNGL